MGRRGRLLRRLDRRRRDLLRRALAPRSSPRRRPSTRPSGSTSASPASPKTPEIHQAPPPVPYPLHAQCVRLLHQLGERLAGLHPHPGTSRPRACSSRGARARGVQPRPRIRGCMETLKGGGTAPGPVSFMRGFDAFAGVIKSRRQDPPRRQDGHPQRRPSRHHRLHRVQARRKRPRPLARPAAGYDGLRP